MRLRVATVVVIVGFALLTVAGSPSAVEQTVPDWQTKAGDSMAFDVASIRPSNPDVSIRPSFPLSADDAYRTPDGSPAVGGRFIADFPLTVFIEFAYKVQPSPQERLAWMAQLPKWAATDRFTIQAKAGISNPTKDQMRLMVQSLLADRFKLAVHFEKQEQQVLELVLAKPGTPGPRLRLHSQGPSCDSAAKGLDPCDAFSLDSHPGSATISSRNASMARIAAIFADLGGHPSAASLGGRTIIDRTGLTDRFDFVLEWTPESSPTEPASGTTFVEALRDQLGLKVVSAKALVDVLIIDHVERPKLD